MSKKSIQDTAVDYLETRLRNIASMIDRQNKMDYILENLNEIRISSSFANEIGLITDDQLQAIREKWYEYSKLLGSLDKA